MPIYASPMKLLGIRVAACLLVVGCSQSLLETYGCACDSRTYTAEEIADYRSAAARDDLVGLAQMEEYHWWRSQEGSLDFRREDRMRQHYRNRRLALRDPDALEEEVEDLIYRAAFDEDSESEQLTLLMHAKFYNEQIPGGATSIDLKDPRRRDIAASRYLDREIAHLERRVPRS